MEKKEDVGGKLEESFSEVSEMTARSSVLSLRSPHGTWHPRVTSDGGGVKCAEARADNRVGAGEGGVRRVPTLKQFPGGGSEVRGE